MGNPKFAYEDELPNLTDEEQQKQLSAIKKKNLSERLLRMYLTPRQKRLLTKLKSEWGMTVSEHVRRAIDDYLDRIILKGDLKDE